MRAASQASNTPTRDDGWQTHQLNCPDSEKGTQVPILNTLLRWPEEVAVHVVVAPVFATIMPLLLRIGLLALRRFWSLCWAPPSSLRAYDTNVSSIGHCHLDQQYQHHHRNDYHHNYHHRRKPPPPPPPLLLVLIIIIISTTNSNSLAAVQVPSAPYKSSIGLAEACCDA